MNTDPQQAAQFMRYAIALGRKGMEAGEGGPFGAIIVKNGQIIGEGWNQVIVNNDPTAHGEMVAIRNACIQLQSFELSGCALYTSGQPCPMCLGAAYWARLAKVYYGFSITDAASVLFDDQLIFAELNKPMAEQSIPQIQLLHTEALLVLKDYAARPDRIMY